MVSLRAAHGSRKYSHNSPRDGAETVEMPTNKRTQLIVKLQIH